MVSRLDHIYYRRELAYLREKGKVFAESYPEVARYLGLAGDDPSLRDPHAERIVETFAFLMGRVARFQEARYPRFVQSLLALVHPSYLRPLPCKTLVAFEAAESMLDKPTRIPAGTELYADNLGPGGARYTFTTCWDVIVQPLFLDKVYVDPEAPGDFGLSIVLRAHAGATLADCDWDNLDLAIRGEPTTCTELFLKLAEELRRVGIKGNPESAAHLGVELIGFRTDRDYGEPEDGRTTHLHHLRDYFDDFRRFTFFRINGLGRYLDKTKETSVQIDLTFDKPYPPGIIVGRDNLALHACVAQNLFEADCEPIRIDAEGLEHVISPDIARGDLEVVSIARVLASKDREVHEVRPYYRFARRDLDEKYQWFYAVRRDHALEQGWDTFVRLIDMQHDGPGALEGYTLTVKALCSNRHFAQKLKLGQLRHVSRDIPEMIKVENLSQATQAGWPPLNSDEGWDFMAHMALDHTELENPDALKTLLELYATNRDEADLRRIRGITHVEGEHDYIIRLGTAIPGRRLTLDVAGNHFNGLGDLCLFTRVFGHFLRAYCPINGFVRLIVRDTETKTTFSHVTWG